MWRLRTFVALVAPLCLAACVYIPTPEHGLVSGRAMIRDSDIAALVPGKSTREDVLLLLGDPGERIGDDEFFCYRWERVRGWIGVGAGGAGAAGDVGKAHYFCAQFSADNVYLRGKRIEGFLFGSAAKKRDEIIRAWDSGSIEPASTEAGP